ncbi:MAG: DUF58 domain-containing protein [Candidatus Omnitrophica bacterium]|nr:DUF58 domain-containing protein [Candidatus Omnitrophota bacterium]
MIPRELFSRVRRIQITTSRLVTDVFAGQYHSVFKGQGIEFEEVREYQPGDDVRSIDWNVTARTGTVHIKKFVEERELTVMIMVDASMSCRFATVNELKSKLAAEIAALLAFSAIRNNDKVGLIIFTDKIEKFIPPRKGIKSVLRAIREVLYFEPQSSGTDLVQALDYLNKVMTRRAVVFLISDFLEPQEHGISLKPKEPKFKIPMTIANKRHDVVAITLNDPQESHLTGNALLTLEDAETGEIVTVDSSDSHVRRMYSQQADERLRQRSRLFRSISIDHVDISTDSSYMEEFVKFFVERKRRVH